MASPGAGDVVVQYPTGETYVGQTKPDGRTPHGRGVMTYKDSSRYEGEALLRDGNTNGAVYEGEWRDGTMHGRGAYSFRDGRVFDGAWASRRPLRGTATEAGGAPSLAEFDGRTDIWEDGAWDEATRTAQIPDDAAPPPPAPAAAAAQLPGAPAASAPVPAPGPAPAQEMDADLARLLREWRLDPAELRQPLAALGVARVEDLLDMEEAHVAGLGLKPIPAARFARNIAARKVGGGGGGGGGGSGGGGRGSGGGVGGGSDDVGGKDMDADLARLLREWRLDPAELQQLLAALGVARVEDLWYLEERDVDGLQLPLVHCRLLLCLLQSAHSKADLERKRKHPGGSGCGAAADGGDGGRGGDGAGAG